MRTNLLVVLICGCAVLSACQKQETEEDRRAEIEREVQTRLAGERQAQERQQLEQREADLDAREKALADSDAVGAAAEKEIPTPARPRPPVTEPRRGEAASYDLFYTRLEPHGSWIETRDYGYVWQPREAGSRSWRPYVNGHWVYTDAGWTWVSEEPFGWATYHYGRWTKLRNIGWIWVPGDEWASAWVSWRKGDDYVGWAPLPPEAQFDRRTGIRNWADNYYDIGPTQYCFVPTAQFGASRVERTIVPAEQNITIINRTTNVTNITYNNVTVVNHGPSYDELRGRTQQPIPRLRLERQVTIDVAAQPREPVVRGEVIQMVAPVVQRAQPAQRPREIRRAIAQTEVDHGWTDIGNNEAARQARAKMKSEATPPSDAPSKVIAPNNRADGATTAPSATPALTTSSPAVAPTPATSLAASPVATPVRSTPSPTTRETATPALTPVQSTASPSATVTPSPPLRSRTDRRLMTPVPSASPTATQAGSPAAGADSNAVRPQPDATGDQRPKAGGRLKSQAKRFDPRRIEPNAPGVEATTAASPSASPTASPQTNGGNTRADSSPSQPIHERSEAGRRRAGQVRRHPGGPATSESAGQSTQASPAPTPSATP